MAIITSFPCSSCGARVPETARRCPACGHDTISSAVADAPRPESPTAYSASASHSTPPHPPSAPAPSKGPGFLTAYVIVLLALLAANIVARLLDNPVHQLALYGVVLAVFVLVPYLRRIALKAVLVFLVVVACIFSFQNFSALRAGELGPRDVVVGMVGMMVDVGPGRQVRRAVEQAGEARSLLNYAEFLDKVSHTDPVVRTVAEGLVEGCDDGDRLCETSRILRAVVDRVEYRSDPRNTEFIKAPVETLESRSGDCEDQAILLVSLLQSLGHTTYLAFTDQHAYAVECFERPVLDMLVGAVANNRRLSGTEYLLDIAPDHDPEKLRAALKGMRELSKDELHCYPLEPTAPGSWIGFRTESHRYVVAIDPVTKDRFEFQE